MIALTNAGAELFAPDGLDPVSALERTTAMGIGAHQDDLEILAYHGVLSAFGRDDAWFAAVVMTNGSGSARIGPYAAYSDEEMCQVRRQEQKKAAVVGGYGAVALLDYPSSAIKNAAAPEPVADLKTILRTACPEVVY
ncbi:MAG: PIG-L family deacetylase, partial [Lentisphaeria bacterium]|nr:PIG-L family deacetylase [Lentisphaeria bacterium]